MRSFVRIGAVWAAVLATATWTTGQDPVPPAPAGTQQQFEAKFAEWKGVLKELRTLQSQYQTADDEQAAAIVQQWDQLMQRGAALLDELRVTGMAAYEAAPNQNRELTRFLFTMVEDDVNRDRYEQALVVAEVLDRHNCGIKELYPLAGTAAFAVHEFDKADHFLKQAVDAGVLGDTAGLQAEVDKYKQLWAEEQVIRKQEAEADDLPRVKLTTSKGDIVLELFENEAPGAVGNFISLVKKGFYDNLTFHRVLPGFMAQGGDPNGDGTGGPGYNIYCECYQPNHRKHFRGSLSMAKGPNRDSGGSQFFLTFRPTPHLNGKHTVFGRVIEGLDVLAELQRRNPDDAEEQNPPVPDQIIKAEVLRDRGHDYKPNKVE